MRDKKFLTPDKFVEGDGVQVYSWVREATEFVRSTGMIIDFDREEGNDEEILKIFSRGGNQWK